MYAVIESGGKQHRVTEGELLKVEKIKQDEGASLEFDKVLLLSNDGTVSVGTPYVDGSKVSAEIIRHGRHKKVRIVKFKRRKHHLKQAGHRQSFTEIKITGIC